MTAPLVSVVVPTFNRGFCVGDAVQSVLDQTYSSVECLVVDDGSTDDTVERLRDAFAPQRRVRLLAGDHGGVSAARNRGVAAAAGRYVTFLDSDDLMVPTRIERQVALLAGGGCDAVIGRHQVLAGDAPFPGWLQARPDWCGGPYHTSVMVGTAHARAVGGFDESMALGEDVDFVARLVGAGLRVGQLDETIVVRRYFGDNLTYGIEAGDRSPLLATVRRHLVRRREPGAC